MDIPANVLRSFFTAFVSSQFVRILFSIIVVVLVFDLVGGIFLYEKD